MQNQSHDHNVLDTSRIGSLLMKLSTPLFFGMFIQGIYQVSVGGASLISRLIGQREKHRAERALGNSIFFAMLFSLILTAAFVPFTDFWLKVIGTSDNVMPLAKSYTVITMSGTIL